MNFDLWFTHISGSNPELSRRLSALLSQGTTLTPAEMEMLHAEYLAPEIDIKAITDGSAELQDVAQNMVEQIAGN
ncbi:MAG: hypothetical protein ACREQ5_37520, partial [Candidatus Dormibacteria bacterium]